MKKFFTLIVALMTTMFSANAEEIVLFEGSEALSWDGTVMDVSGITATSDLTLHVTLETTSGIWWQFKFVQSGVDGWPALKLIEGREFIQSGTDVDYPWTAGTYKYDFELNEEQIAILKTGAAVQGGLGEGEGEVYLKKVTVTTNVSYGDAVDLTECIDENGNILAKSFNGFSDDAKVEFIWNATNIDGVTGYGAGSLTSLGDGSNTGVSFSIKQEGEHSVCITLGELKEALNAGPDKNNRYGLNWNIWPCHNEKNDNNVNNRVALKIYEVEGFDGEGYLSPDSQVDPDAPTWEEDGKTILSAESDPENYGIWTLIPASVFDGYTLGAKVIFTFEVEGADGFANWGIGRYGSSNLTYNEKNELVEGVVAGDLSVAKEGKNVVEKTLADLKDALTTGPDAKGRYGLLVNIWICKNKDTQKVCKVTNVNVEIKELCDTEGQEVFEAPEDVQTMIGINSVSASNGIMYNLAGQRVSDMKGIVVKDGKKLVIK